MKQLLGLFFFTLLLLGCASEKDEKITAFWTWFESVQADCLIDSKCVAQGNQLIRELHKDISFAIDRPKEDGSRKLIFSVNWNADAIPNVYALVAQQPQLEHWHIMALDEERSAKMIFMENGDYDGSVSTSDVYFIHRKTEEGFFFEFFIKEYNAASEDLEAMVSDLIYGEIGELKAVKHIQTLRLRTLDASSNAPLEPLTELSQVFEDLDL